VNTALLAIVFSRPLQLTLSLGVHVVMCRTVQLQKVCGSDLVGLFVKCFLVSSNFSSVLVGKEM
jgi:hypothetical protein